MDEAGAAVFALPRERLRAAVAGDPDAFADVYRAMNPLLLRCLRVLAGAGGEDVASETWAKFVPALRTFSGDAAGFRAWLFTIARRAYLDQVRRAGRRPVTSDGWSAARPVRPGERAPGTQAARGGAHPAAGRAPAALFPPCR